MSAPEQEIPVEATPVEAAPVEGGWPEGSSPKLVCIRGKRVGIEYPVYEGKNFIGRSDEQPVDIDLEDQENPEQVWSSRQHCLLTFENCALTITDLGSSNGTYLNRDRLVANTPIAVKPEDVIQIGTIRLQLKA